jgi:hypothetical protein
LALMTASANAGAQAVGGPKTPLNLICHVAFADPPQALDVNVVVDFQNQTANGHPAEITDSYVLFKFSDGVGDNRREYQWIINRYTGGASASITRTSTLVGPISATGTGTCSLAGERKF